MAATATSPPIAQPSAEYSADQAWHWDGSRWQPSSTEIPVGRGLRSRLRFLALPLSLSPGLVGPLLLLPVGFVLFIVSVNAAADGSAEWPGLFVMSFVLPAMAVPLAIMRVAMGFGVGAYRHDLTSKTFWRTRAPAALLPLGERIGGWRLRPRIDAAAIRAALSAHGPVEVDHGAAGAVVFAIRDAAGKSVYELKAVARSATWSAAIAALALLWTIIVSLTSLGFVNQLRAGALDDIASAEKNLAALDAAKPCESGLSTRQCYLIDTTTISKLEPKATRGAVTAICAAGVDAGGTYELTTDCGAAPQVGSKVTLRNWAGKVVDVNYQGQVIDTVDSPRYELAGARRRLQGAEAFTWIWALAPVLYVLLVAAGDIHWWLSAARRHARYAVRRSPSPTGRS